MGNSEGYRGQLRVSGPNSLDRVSREVDTAPWPRAEFERKLREQRAGYHVHHPFNVMLSSGKASREQVRGWVANRFYYQVNIPIKDPRFRALMHRMNLPDEQSH